MTTINRVSNANARQYVENKQEFKGNNTFSELNTIDNIYVVYSYGYHYPMFISKNAQWYENKDKYSVTTSKHHNQLRPLVDNIILLSTQEMKGL